MSAKYMDYYLDYVPQKIEGITKEQQEARQKMLLFLDGDCPQDIKDFIVEKAQHVAEDNSTLPWVIGFIPAPDETSTIIRYGDLALDLGNRTDCEVFLDLFSKMNADKNKDKYCLEKNRVEGKGVILIDAIYTTGKRYRQFSSMLKKTGAKSVHGLIIGKTSLPCVQ